MRFADNLPGAGDVLGPEDRTRQEVAVRPRQWTAFEEFVLGHGDALVRLSFALCGDRGKAEDATQEALTRVYLRWSLGTCDEDH
jgi:DNA-directed RNA polymerase specialized sigma24 family protein